MIGVVTMYNLILAQQPDVTTDQLREQIRQTVRQATADARRATADAQQAGRDAQRVTIEQVPPVPPVGTPIISVNGRGIEGDIPPRAKDVSIAFFVVLAFIIVGLPIMRAIGKRIERGAPAPTQIPAEMQAQMQHLMQSVDAIAIEVERISEGQRFATKLLTEKKTEV
jgi:hypothetical protein